MLGCECVCKCVCIHVYLRACLCLTCQLVHVGVVLKSTTSMGGSDHEQTVHLTSTSEQVVNLKTKTTVYFEVVLTVERFDLNI